MRISGILTKELITTSLHSTSRDQVISELVELINTHVKLGDSKEIADLVIKREEIHPTGVGRGVAIPHARVAGIKDVIIAAGIHPEGIDFKSRDGSKSKIIFLMLAPENDTTLYLQCLSSLAMLMMIGELGEKLLTAKTPDEFLELFTIYENI
jgi:PTS system fructose-specific IIC component